MAVQSLYAWLVNPIDVLKLMRVSEEDAQKPFDRDYYRKLVVYATENKERLFAIMDSKNQAAFFEHNAEIERSLLLVSMSELLVSPEIPRPVVIDQAVILAKRFGPENCHQFINAMLDKMAQDLKGE